MGGGSRYLPVMGISACKDAMEGSSSSSACAVFPLLYDRTNQALSSSDMPKPWQLCCVIQHSIGPALKANETAQNFFFTTTFCCTIPETSA